MTSPSTLDTISPFFVVDSLAEAIAFYQQKLGFVTDILAPEENPFFAIMRRDRVSIILKEIAPDVHPMPNSTRHQWARWDALIMSSDPDAIFAEFESRGVKFHEPLENTEEGLRAFEVKDNSGYVLCFARPL